MRLLLTSGGTLGSVSPLIAIAQKLQEKDSHLETLWLGTKKGAEKDLILNYGFNYKSIPAGKLRRYCSCKNITDLGKTFLGFLKSLYIIFRFKPNFVIGAGSFVQVPVIYAAKFLFNKPHIIIHQQDIKKGLANHLCAKLADRITVSTPSSLADFPAHKSVFTGNPYRPEIQQGKVNTALKIFKLKNNMPVILILGGGTGAWSLNQLVVKSLEGLTKFCQIIHIAGKEKQIKIDKRQKINLNHYCSFEFMMENLKHAYAIADLIISRAGFSTLTELSVLAKPTIIIPLPQSHQQENANFFQQKEAAIVLKQDELEPQIFTKTVKETLENNELRFRLSSNISKIIPADSTNKFITEIAKMASQEIGVKRW